MVNTKSLQNLEDKKDDFGIWKYSGSHPLVFKFIIKMMIRSLKGAQKVHQEVTLYT